MEKTKEFNIYPCYLFIDFKAAYYSVIRHKLYEAIEEFNIPIKLINLTKTTLKTVKCTVKLGKELSEVFYIRTDDCDKVMLCHACCSTWP